MTSKTKVLNFVQKYTMIIALVLVTAFFAWRTNGKILMPQNHRRRKRRGPGGL